MKACVWLEALLQRDWTLDRASCLVSGVPQHLLNLGPDSSHGARLQLPHSAGVGCRVCVLGVACYISARQHALSTATLSHRPAATQSAKALSSARRLYGLHCKNRDLTCRQGALMRVW